MIRQVFSLILALQIALPTISFAETKTPYSRRVVELTPVDKDDVPTRPYNKCELKLVKLSEGIRSVIEKGIARLDEIISPVNEWSISEEDGKEITKIFEDESLSMEQSFDKAYEALLKAKLKTMNPVSRFFVGRAARDGVRQSSIYSHTLGRLIRYKLGPHYNPLFNRMATYARPNYGATPMDTIIAIHESEHLIHRNTNPLFWAAMVKVFSVEILSAIFRTPLTVPFRRRMEVRAMGAQWEMARLIPEAMRKDLIEQANLPQISHKERILVNALFKTGIMDRLRGLMYKGLRLNDVGMDSIENREAMDASLIYSMFGASRRLKWFSTFKARANSLTQEELDYLKGVYKQGVNFKPISEELNKFLDQQSIDEQLHVDPAYQARVYQAEYTLQSIRYPDTMLESLKRIYVESLKNAGESKEEFIRRLSDVHGYTLSNITRAHYHTDMRIWLLYLAVSMGMSSYQTGLIIIPQDLNFIYEMFLYFTGPKT